VSITTGDFRSKITASTLLEKKQRNELITCLTAYDYASARLVDEAGIDMILVGDSLAMVMLGYENTLPVTMQEMLHHTRAVHRGVKHAFLIADMPFASYHVSQREALRNATRFVRRPRMPISLSPSRPCCRIRSAPFKSQRPRWRI